MISPTARAALGLALGLVAAVAAAADPPADVKVGDKAPAFEARTEADKTWTSSDNYGKKWVVVYFYPGDFTPGCTAQAKAFNAKMNKLAELGVEVGGVSGDSAASHAGFKQAQGLNFTLLSDEDGAVAKSFGVPFGKGATVKAKDADGKAFEFTWAGTAARWTFVVGKDGKVVYNNKKANPTDDAQKVIDFVTGGGR